MPVRRVPPPAPHALRRHSVEDLQKAIAAGLADLIGPDYKARIIKRDFEPKAVGAIAGMSEAVGLVVRAIPVDDEPEIPF